LDTADNTADMLQGNRYKPLLYSHVCAIIYFDG